MIYLQLCVHTVTLLYIIFNMQGVLKPNFWIYPLNLEGSVVSPAKFKCISHRCTLDSSFLRLSELTESLALGSEVASFLLVKKQI